MTYADLPSLYAGAKATLIPSISLETFGLTALESFAQRTPVIAHRIGALPETITQTGGGLLYSSPEELGEILDRFETDTGLRQTLGERGHSGLSAYRPEPFLQQYLQVIEEELAKKNTR